MKYQDFVGLACYRRRPDTPGFYKLERFDHAPDATYVPRAVDGGYIWSYDERLLSEVSNYEYYPTFDEAHDAMMSKIGKDGAYAFVIRKLGYGPSGTKDFYIHFTSYDANGEEILHSVCSSYHYNLPGVAGKFLGRDDATVRFNFGDIVQIDQYGCGLKWKQGTLGIVVGLPWSPKEFWELYEEDLRKLGPELADDRWFEQPSTTGSDDDEYFIQIGPYDGAMSNFTFRNAIDIHLPALPIADTITESLRGYYRNYLEHPDA